MREVVNSLPDVRQEKPEHVPCSVIEQSAVPLHVSVVVVQMPYLLVAPAAAPMKVAAVRPVVLVQPIERVLGRVAVDLA